MSLYNLLHGVNPLSSVLLSLIQIEEVPRFRDVFLDPETDSIVVHTRTGGGNRDFYESESVNRENFPEDWEDADEAAPKGPWNEDLRNSPYYTHDEDDDFDCTYANFYFTYPPNYRGLLKEIADMNNETPREKWEKVLSQLQETAK